MEKVNWVAQKQRGLREGDPLPSKGKQEAAQIRLLEPRGPKNLSPCPYVISHAPPQTLSAPIDAQQDQRAPSAVNDRGLGAGGGADWAE